MRLYADHLHQARGNDDWRPAAFAGARSGKGSMGGWDLSIIPHASNTL